MTLKYRFTPEASHRDGAAARAPPHAQSRAEVLTLLGQRLTNAEIADRLFIGHGTVATHVANLLAKLGAANGHEAAAIAVRSRSAVTHSLLRSLSLSFLPQFFRMTSGGWGSIVMVFRNGRSGTRLVGLSPRYCRPASEHE
jgi:DNA-binding CsgD family transcriptional regulator